MMRDYLDTKSSNLKVREEQTALPPSWRPFLVALLLGMVATFLLVLDVRGLLAPVRGGLQQTMNPLAVPMTSVRNDIADFLSDLKDFQRLREENRLLKHRVSQLETDQIMRDQIIVENARLRQQLQIEGRYPWRLVGAEVIIRSPDAGRRVITIARGRAEGVRQGMAVIGQTGSEPAALVGIVEEVNTHTASVLLITDVSCKISARVLYDGTLALGLVQGQWQNGSRLRLEQLDREIPLRSGRVVLSAGLTGELLLPLPLTSVPPGIPIGSVERIIESDGLTQFAELRPYIDPDQVRYVWIVLNHDE